MRISLDIETTCGQGCKEKCDHALDAYRNRVTVVGVYYEHQGTHQRKTFRQLGVLRDWLVTLDDFRLVGHNLKWDLHTLAVKGLDLTAFWADDTLLMAATLTEKIPEHWLQNYETERAARNKALKRGFSHRPGSPHSLKCLAPFFLDVEPFWENPENHDNDDYVLKDVEYTYKLASELEKRLRVEGSYEFYQRKLLPWTQMLLAAERRGVSIDLPSLEQADAKAQLVATDARQKLDELWAPAREAYLEKERAKVRAAYSDMESRALAKAKVPGRTQIRYQGLAAKAMERIQPLNLDSPTQLKWLLRDHLQLDIEDFDGEETTGKAVLQRLAGQGREDIAQFLRYRKARKLTTAFFPSYREMQVDGALHCSFNPTGTRTGRLSSSGPNLQQVERGLHHLFVARPGFKLATFDESAIEPRLIAYYSGDEHLYQIVSQGLDFHNYNTAIFFELNHEDPEFKAKHKLEREVGKEVALALMYGAGTNRLMESAQKRGFVWTKSEARRKLDRFREFYQGVFRFREQVINPALESGEIVRNLFGRPFTIQDRSNVHMQGMNTLIQGSASDLVLNSAQRIMAAFKADRIDGHVLLLVHDEIVVEVPADAQQRCVEIITTAMTNYPLSSEHGPIELKVEGKVADSWEK